VAQPLVPHHGTHSGMTPRARVLPPRAAQLRMQDQMTAVVMLLCLPYRLVQFGASLNRA